MAKRKVMLVEDEPSIHTAMKNVLERKGCEVFIAVNADQAWEIFQKETPAACSIDLHLGHSRLDGLGLLKQIKEANKDTLCLIFSVVVEDSEKKQAKDLGADYIFLKPPVNEEYQAIIEILAGTYKGEE
jgi:DNA-binding response OmpR family regulator